MSEVKSLSLYSNASALGKMWKNIIDIFIVFIQYFMGL